MARHEGVFNSDSSNTPWETPAPVYEDQVPGEGYSGPSRLHDKYMLIDPEAANSDPIVITGSANWSENACENNDENILMIHDYRVAKQYLQHFIARYEEAGGEYPLNER